ncbi:MAG: hypothetical protein U0M60_10060 [Clostridia bacterium]|nr:hypothetical protein [Clostridia bacterium]
MFNFNTTKKQNEPNLNTAAVGAQKREAAPVNTMPGREGGQMQNGYINSQIEQIEAQRREFMKKNPDFDMKSEMQNPQFVEYVWKNKLSVEDAYFLVHREELIEKAVAEALRRIEARRGRISENGAGKNSPAVVKKNPKEMSDKEIDSIIERVRNGEKISF